MKHISLKAPAKLNLLLKVVNKRKDGYHNLVTLFERIDLQDTLQFNRNAKGQIRIFCDCPDVPTGPKNLIHKAAMLLKEGLKLKEGVDIKVIKRIPVAAGLGGGSSDAATTLIGLNQFWKLSLTRAQLLTYARALGSDVPFFLYDASWALGQGRGDKIIPLPMNAKLWHILVVPPIKVYSREVFENFKGGDNPNLKTEGLTNQLTLSISPSGEYAENRFRGLSADTNVLTKQNPDVNILTALRKKELQQVNCLLFNDLEKTIISLKPPLLKAKNRLSKLLSGKVIFSGSGPAFFGLTVSRAQAMRLRQILKRRYSQVYVVRTL